MICRHCRAELPEGSSFCNRCGGPQMDAPAGAQPFSAPAATKPAAEETLWKGRYSARAAAHLWFLWALWIAAVIAAYVLFVEVGSSALRWTFAVAALLPGLWIALKIAYKKVSMRYRLTNQRMFRDSGILSRRHDELELIRVDDVSVAQNVVQRVFRVGLVTLHTTDTTDPKLTIEGIEDPVEVKERIRELVRARRSRATFLEKL
jgi:membrane protein YdbS with pleckstrin-like domain